MLLLYVNIHCNGLSKPGYLCERGGINNYSAHKIALAENLVAKVVSVGKGKGLDVGNGWEGDIILCFSYLLDYMIMLPAQKIKCKIK